MGADWLCAHAGLTPITERHTKDDHRRFCIEDSFPVLTRNLRK
ncbi:hypothetical protein SAMN05421819_3042 [Bryocella elongata]|uniref:Uncharacterized protein n=1 Tax=Bryocella elongata TaxID=863522 RepID=A0A1H6AAV1_9BACT|nr:hypothetical protein SAMN05421819_3042 [Bryocella elongata]